MSMRRYDCNATVANGKVFIIGGNEDGLPNANIEAFDSVSETWSKYSIMEGMFISSVQVVAF